MSPEAQFLFYNAQMVSARVGWTPPTLYNPRLKDRLFRATVPTLIVTSTGDKLVPSALAEIYAGGIPNAEISQITDSAHAVWLEQPQKAAEAVAQFLNRE
jgi:pimeloyl-ACP methyl ester carboxylesterase